MADVMAGDDDIAFSGRRPDADDPSLVEIVRVQPVMGTVITISAWGPVDNPIPVDAATIRALSWMQQAEDRFTTFRPSEWLRMAAGDLPVEIAHPDIGYVLEMCRRLERITDGAFSLHARPDKPMDPAAYVKGWATQRAADLLMDAGAVKVCINCGGDIVVAGGDKPWRLGIQDPFDRQKLRGVVEIERGAVATSGLYERGEHLYDPDTGTPALGWASVTVVGPDLGLADAFSTALFVAGHAASREWFERQTDYSAYFIANDGSTETIRFALED